MLSFDGKIWWYDLVDVSGRYITWWVSLYLILCVYNPCYNISTCV